MRMVDISGEGKENIAKKTMSNKIWFFQTDKQHDDDVNFYPRLKWC